MNFYWARPSDSDATGPRASQHREATGARRRTRPRGRNEPPFAYCNIDSAPTVGTAATIGVAEARRGARVLFTLLEGPP